MIALFLLPFYIILNVYIIIWLFRWTKACLHYLGHIVVRIIISSVYTLIAFSGLIGFFLPPCAFERYCKMTFNYWLGISAYMLMTVVVADILRIIYRKLKKYKKKQVSPKSLFISNGAICVAIITSISIYGAVNSRIIRTTDYEINVDKSCENVSDLNIVLLADLHLGYNIGCRQMEKAVEKINAQKPDLVVIAGDIFDNEYEALDNPDKLIELFNGINSKYGVYACTGNHDVNEKILAGFTFKKKDNTLYYDNRMYDFLEKANIKLLVDEYALIDNSFYLYGRPDSIKLAKGVTQRKTPEQITSSLDKSKPIIVIDHQPSELSELSNAGVDIDLSGHTHDGQMFPGNILTDIVWENSCGHIKKGDMHSIVTSGIGVFGPNMRVLTKAEICVIKVHFSSKSVKPTN